MQNPFEIMQKMDAPGRERLGRLAWGGQLEVVEAVWLGAVGTVAPGRSRRLARVGQGGRLGVVETSCSGHSSAWHGAAERRRAAGNPAMGLRRHGPKAPSTGLLTSL